MPMCVFQASGSADEVERSDIYDLIKECQDGNDVSKGLRCSRSTHPVQIHMKVLRRSLHDGAHGMAMAYGCRGEHNRPQFVVSKSHDHAHAKFEHG